MQLYAVNFIPLLVSPNMEENIHRTLQQRESQFLGGLTLSRQGKRQMR